MADAGLDLAGAMFAALRQASLDPPGVSRASYGAGERAAHAIARAEAERLGLEIRTDPVGTLFMTLPGADRGLKPLLIGSHLDAVSHGGNFDGAAGVVMGLALAARLRAAGRVLPRDLTVLGIRAEEMVWFPMLYLGSRAAFGLLPPEAPDVLRRTDSQRTLAEHMTEEGFDPGFIRAGSASLDPARIHAFLEPHIEQGPVLVAEGVPAAVVTGIRGSIRYRACTATGAWAHAGAVPRDRRRDAVLAVADLAMTLERFWRKAEAAGRDLVLTMGECFTDPAMQGVTKVPGKVTFTLDIRSEDAAMLEEAEALLGREAARIAAERGVAIAYGEKLPVPPAVMDAGLRAALLRGAERAGVPVRQMASGAGHDALTFAGLGVPTAMLFIRNDHGSHNPAEAMELADFAAALDVLEAAIGEIAA
ncbi:Zn-dependent hydrolase [Siccirubricoccus sp. KC 17139]|uniref:Zn-dependent hydrolase n=1 Tax=Siccirubricoccus soli TaxID=2899147 RepID=A0ABT1D4J7_9PROT|nr:Zn-dependent hydrolase [Siccirubricoccus soli]MCO6416857.1 Zn-dependent hydrolase [Siccirubricoccus soli]MCP2682992.1 Zn-dependent hydrolase [Siccirubricoccus soli]